jgi:hypothetical protein
MDIPCPRCGEPWEIDSLHDAAEDLDYDYAEAARAFARRGCAVMLGRHAGTACDRDDLADTRYDLADLAGDDLDGWAADIADFGRMIPGLIR